MTTAKNYRAPSSGFPKVVLDEQWRGAEGMQMVLVIGFIPQNQE